MLNIKKIIKNKEKIISILNTRQINITRKINNVIFSYQEYQKKLFLLNNLRYEKNILIKKMKNIFHLNKEEKKEILLKSKNLNLIIHQAEEEKNHFKIKFEKQILTIPNIIDESVPFGKNEQNNLILKKNGLITNFNFKIQDHFSLGEKLKILNFKQATEITGSRFVVFQKLGASLKRALINFAFDFYNQKKYQEIIFPYIVNEQSLINSGQFPKFKKEIFSLKNKKWFLNPTAEVPGISFLQKKIIPLNELPFSFCAFTTAFRSEAGASGKDTKGILRQHQFDKLELLHFTHPENSYLMLDKMLKDVEEIFQLLKLPYRVVSLCTGDLGFTSAKTYDIEVWIPSQQKYREVASLSNTEDFQSRRAQIKFINTKKEKDFVHILNGTGLAIERCIVAILENYQNKDGTINVPDVLKPYMKIDIIS